MTHTSFCAINKTDRQQMFTSLNVTSFDDLFSDIPPSLQNAPFDLQNGCSEMEMVRQLESLASANATNLTNFCGAGFYDHYIPSAVDAITSRGEFFTAYTPYQPEASQGTLQTIYEYQTAICRLTDMEVANASLYDGGTALFEGLMMALRVTRRNHVLVDQGVSPIYRTMLRSYTTNLNISYEEIPLTADGLADRDAFRSKMNKDVAAIVVQNPNFFGCLDDLTDLSKAAHEAGALAVLSAYPIALGLIKTPGAMGADIVTGEGQSLGLPLSFGGPYLGFMSTRKKYARKMPGRICGATQDEQGRRGYVLTLQAREQHIRRQKAMSNICSNQALCALRALVYLSLTGKEGLPAVARACAHRAQYAFERLTAIPGIEAAFKQPFFNEFAIKLPCPAAELISRLLQEDIAIGFPPGRYYTDMDDILLLAFTEQHSRKDIDQLVAHISSVL